jgi:hypothetical protein
VDILTGSVKFEVEISDFDNKRFATVTIRGEMGHRVLAIPYMPSEFLHELGTALAQIAHLMDEPLSGEQKTRFVIAGFAGRESP